MTIQATFFSYPARIEEDEGSYVITFRDIEEAIAQADSAEGIVAAAVLAVEEVAGVYMREDKPFPPASEPQEGEVVIDMPAGFAVKIALHNARLGK